MNKPILLLGVLLVLCSLPVSAVLNDALIYYSFDDADLTGSDPDDLSGNGNDGTNTGAATGASGKLNECFDFELADTDSVDIGVDVYNAATMASGTICLWANMESAPAANDLSAVNIEGAAVVDLNRADNRLTRGMVYDGVSAFESWSTDNMELGEWHQYCLTWDTSDQFLYIDGELNDTDSSGSPDLDSISRAWRVGADWNNGNYFDGLIDELGIWGRDLSLAEVQTLYNNFAAYNPYSSPAGSPTAFFSVSAYDFYDNASVQVFTVVLSNGTEYHTSNGTVTTNINVSLGDEWSFSVNNTDYFTRDFNDINTSTNYEAYIYQSQVNFSAFEIVSNISLEGAFYINGTLASDINYLRASYYNFTFVNTTYYDRSFFYTVPALFNGTVNITEVYAAILNITAQNAYTSEIIYNFTGWIYNGTYDYNESFTANGSAAFVYAADIDYLVYVEHIDYAISDSANYETVTVSGNDFVNVSFDLWSNNSIHIYVYDETTNNLITDNITITLTSNVTETIYYTTSGEHFLSDLTDGSYSVKFSGGNYTTKTYYVTVADRSTQTLNAYLSSDYQTVTFTIKDSLSEATLEGASLQMSRLINSTWTVVESKNSDITGRAQFSYIPNVAYRFYFTMSEYTDKLFTLDPVIFSTYTVYMVRTVDITLPYDFMSISTYYYPKQFFNDQENNVSFIISSPDGALESYGIFADYGAGQRAYASGKNSIGGMLLLNFTITGTAFGDTVNITYWYDPIFAVNKSFKAVYSINGFAHNNNTWISNADADYGMGDLEKVSIATVWALVLGGAGAMAGGFVGAIVMILLAFGIFLKIGLLSIWTVLIAVLVGVVLLMGRGGR